MNAPLPKPDHRTLPRKKRPPAPRDEAIYLLWHVQGWSQEQLAREFGLSQSRVSQVLRRVKAWLGGGQLDPAARLRAERWLERGRHEEIFRRALREYDAGVRQVTTTKRGERDGKTYSETIVRDVPPSVQLLKVAQRSAEALGKAADKPQPPPARDAAEEARASLSKAEQTLCSLREEAEDAGKVAKSSIANDGYSVWHTVNAWMSALLGEPAIWVRPPHVAPGTPLSELSQSYVASVAWGGPPAGPEIDEPSAMDVEHAGRPEARPTDGLSNPSNPNMDETSQVAEQSQLAPTKPHDNTGPPNDNTAPPHDNTAPPEGETDPWERRRLHMERLELLRQARRRGLPIHFLFDPADGPLPPPPSYDHGAIVVYP